MQTAECEAASELTSLYAKPMLSILAPWGMIASERSGRLISLRAVRKRLIRVWVMARNARMLFGKGVPLMPGDREQFRVAQAPHSGRARLAANKAHLADGFPPADAPDEALLPVV